MLDSSLKLEACTDFVSGLIQILCVQGESESEGDAGTHLDIVGQGSNTAIVDFSLKQIRGLAAHLLKWFATEMLPLQMILDPCGICRQPPIQHYFPSLNPRWPWRRPPLVN